MIERSLRRDLPLLRIERRARLRADRSIVLAAAGIVAGAVLTVLATSAPVALSAVGMITAGACVGLVFVRGIGALAGAGRRFSR